MQLPVKSEMVANKMATFVMAMQSALEDGWQAGEDIPAMLGAAMTDLIPAIKEIGSGSVKEEFSADPMGVVSCFTLAARGIVK